MIACPQGQPVASRCPVIQAGQSQPLPADQFARVIEASPSALIMIGPDGTIEMVNRQAEQIFGYQRHLLLGRQLEILLPARYRARHVGLRERFLERASTRKMGEGRDLHGLRQDGSEFPVEIGLNPIEIGGRTMLLAAVLDITERRRAETHIQFLAYHDALTGLANRSLLAERLTRALARAKRRGTGIAVLTLDLDRFKSINDAHGHVAGDRLLVQVAERLRSALRSSDTIARIGGDEFVVLQCDAATPTATGELAGRIVSLLADPIDVGNRTVVIGGSVGVATYPDDGETADELMKRSDMALYRAKSQGGGSFRHYYGEMDREVFERSVLSQELRDAIGTDQLSMHFQPQFTTSSRALIGFEALVRWNHPTRGNIPPTVMIPLAESARLMLSLGAWVIEASCAAAAGWSVPHRVAVNLSAAQFRGGDLPKLVRDVLQRTGLAASRLELEVTESLLIDDTEVALRTLRELKQLGITFALDDFGTGFSSLSYLRMFPFDKIKIDKSFIRDLEQDPSARSIVAAILAMSRSLGMDVVAEGIETESQMTIMRKLRCREVQGYLLGRPMPGEAVPAFIEQAKSRNGRGGNRPRAGQQRASPALLVA